MLNENDVLLLGPYIGDFCQEIMIFSPFIKWINNTLKWENVYISSHINRSFLYDYIPKDRFLPVYEYLSRDEKNQYKLIHKIITQKEFLSIIDKNIKDKIIEKEKCLKKNIIQFTTSYTKFIPTYSIFNKKFEKFKFNKVKTKDIIFIPDMKERKSISLKILNYLKSNYPDDFIIIGDNKCWFEEENWIKNNRSDYFESIYKLMIDYISSAKIIITPNSHWTFIANIQGTYVFSWSMRENISVFRKNGIYNFGNENMVVNTNKKNIIKQIDFAIKNKLNDNKLDNEEKEVKNLLTDFDTEITGENQIQGGQQFIRG